MDYLEFPDLLKLMNDTKKKKKTSFNVAIESCDRIFQLFLHFDQNIYLKLNLIGHFSNSFIEMAQFFWIILGRLIRVIGLHTCKLQNICWYGFLS